MSAKGQPLLSVAGLRWLAGFAAGFAILIILGAARPAQGLTVIVVPAIDTKITSGPAEGTLIEEERPTFEFSATRNGEPFPDATFNCSVDGAPAMPCTTPRNLDRLDEGKHVFAVYAEDREHFTVDPEPAKRSFEIVVEEECDVFEDDEGFEEADEECKEDEADDGPLAPEECLLRSARARVFTYSAQNRVSLVIRYTSFAPTDVNVDYRLSGARGPLKLSPAKLRFVKAGLLRINQRLSDAEMDRVRAARRFTVNMVAPESPRYCRHFGIRHLTIRRSVHSQVVWFQSDSAFGTESRVDGPT